MRHSFSCLCAICIACLVCAPASAAVWSFGADVRAAAGRDDGSAWVATDSSVRLLSQQGTVELEIDMAGDGYGAPNLIATDVYDGSVWITTDQLLLLHFAADGRLEQGTTLAATADALAIDLDESVWVAAKDRLLHFSSDGEWLRTQGLGLADGERVNAVASDALRERIWIATSGGLRLLAYRRSWLDQRIVEQGTVAALAFDPRTGVAMAIVDATLVGVDADSGVPRVRETVLGMHSGYPVENTLV